jgi:hypothetical protein
LELNKDAICHRLCSNCTANIPWNSLGHTGPVTADLYLYSEYLSKEALDGFGISEVGGQVSPCVKYADDPVLLPKEKRCYRV